MFRLQRDFRFSQNDQVRFSREARRCKHRAVQQCDSFPRSRSRRVHQGSRAGGEGLGRSILGVLRARALTHAPLGGLNPRRGAASPGALRPSGFGAPAGTRRPACAPSLSLSDSRSPAAPGPPPTPTHRLPGCAGAATSTSISSRPATGRGLAGLGGAWRGRAWPGKDPRSPETPPADRWRLGHWRATSRRSPRPGSGHKSFTGPVLDLPRGPLHGPTRFLNFPVSQRPPYLPTIPQPRVLPVPQILSEVSQPHSLISTLQPQSAPLSARVLHL